MVQIGGRSTMENALLGAVIFNLQCNFASIYQKTIKSGIRTFIIGRSRGPFYNNITSCSHQYYCAKMDQISDYVIVRSTYNRMLILSLRESPRLL